MCVLDFCIQKMYLYNGSSVHKTCQRPCILGFPISAMLVTDEHVLTGHKNGQLQLIEQDTANTMRQMNGHTNKINFIVSCPELSMMITGSADKTARAWNVETGECVHVLKGHTSYVTCAAVHGTTFVNCN